VDSSFSGQRSCAHNVQEVGSQKPGRVVVRLSMCSNIYVRDINSCRVQEFKIIKLNKNYSVSHLCINLMRSFSRKEEDEEEYLIIMLK
jgi:transcriptional regulator of NAD metabolism